MTEQEWEEAIKHLPRPYSRIKHVKCFFEGAPCPYEGQEAICCGYEATNEGTVKPMAMFSDGKRCPSDVWEELGEG